MLINLKIPQHLELKEILNDYITTKNGISII